MESDDQPGSCGVVAKMARDVVHVRCVPACDRLAFEAKDGRVFVRAVPAGFSSDPVHCRLPFWSLRTHAMGGMEPTGETDFPRSLASPAAVTSPLSDQRL